MTRWLIAGACLLHATVACASLPAQQGQEPDADIARRLERMLVPANGSLRITRDYSSTLFPSLTFYRASVRPAGSHMQVRRAGVVVDGEHLFEISGAADLGRVWQRVSPERSAVAEEVPRWIELLWQTGVLPRCAAVVSSADELAPAFRVFLVPETALSRIAPPERALDDSRQTSRFFVRSVEGVHEIVVTYSTGEPPTVSAIRILSFSGG